MDQLNLKFKYERKRSRTKEDRVEAIKKVWELLQQTSKKNPITQEKLSMIVQIGGESIRDGIKFFKRCGFPVSGAGKGYYLAGETGTTFTVACKQCPECGKYKIELFYGSGKRLRNRLEPQVSLQGADNEK